MKLKHRNFGRTDYLVSELCLSTSNFCRHTSQEESFAILDSFREAGGNFIQTSGICPGVNLGDGLLGLPEKLLGRWLNLRGIDRDSIIIATRIAFTRPVIGSTAAYAELVRRCVEDSIRRMGCRYLDFLVVEWTDAIAPVAESMAAFAAVIASGEVRHVLPANFPSTRIVEGLAAARGSGAIAGLQIDYSLAQRLAFEAGAAKIGADYDLGLVTRSPLAGGHLASRLLSGGLSALRNQASDRHAAIAADTVWPALVTIARGRHRSPAQVALAWVLAHPQITAVLVSVTGVDQLRELFAATQFQLASDELARLGTFRSHPGSTLLAATP